ncbi:LamG-like jellyroll fold domain-containing protein [Sphingobacterium multivorum]|uniref:LamG-like jellyroll fold domain-containing protein n=1 Tax=Sphingobacterium multivorum TaxID=28454 RepID=UPI002FDA824A
MNLNFRLLTIFSLMILGTIFYTSCKKYDNPPPVYEEIKDLAAMQRKVLVINIDGATGEALNTLAPKNLANMQKNSKFTYHTQTTESAAAGWASMLTGTAYNKHQILNDDFEAVHNNDSEEHGDIVSYRNVLDYVSQYKAVTTAMVTTWDELRDYVKNADYSPEVSTDLAVKDSSISILSSVNSLGTIFVDFGDVKKAGEKGGFILDNVLYKEALTKVDEYIGNIVESLNTRKNYTKEEWLVIVTSNHGGDNDVSYQGFTMLYNPAFSEFELKKTGFNTVFFNAKDIKAELNDANKTYDAGQTNSFTVQMDVKLMNLPNAWSSFFSKSTNLSGQTITGWQWAYYPSGKWVVTVGGSANGGSGKQELPSSGQPGTGGWHTYTMTVNYINSSTRTLTMYMDGIVQGSMNIIDRKNIGTTEPFRIGHRAGDSDVLTTYYAANLKYFDVALTESEIQSTANLYDMTQHPRYANLIGYWPLDDGVGSKFYNQIPSGNNFNLSGGYKWLNLGDAYPPSTYPAPIDSKVSVLSTVTDVASVALYWMNIKILSDFSYDGQAILDNFEIEFLKD